MRRSRPGRTPWPRLAPAAVTHSIQAQRDKGITEIFAHKIQAEQVQREEGHQQHQGQQTLPGRAHHPCLRLFMKTPVVWVGMG